MPNLLLHSLAEFRELLFGLLDDAGPRHVVEIGAESGRFTEELARWAEVHDATVTTIDPEPAPAVRALADAKPGRLRVVAEPSLPALGRVEPADFYLVDGDHNFYTVSNELWLIGDAASRAATTPVVVLHDVGWPCGRRDQYYDPQRLPPEHVHPHRYDRGVHLDSAGMVEGGFSGAGAFAHAEREGGPANGVLTAVEAFLEGRPGWELYNIPAIFGLGVVFPSAHAKRAAMAERLRFYHANPLLARLEENRLRLFLEVLDLQSGHERMRHTLASLQGAWYVRWGTWVESKWRALRRRGGGNCP